MADPDEVRQESDRFSLRSNLFAPASAERAYAVFTGSLADWWVREYTWSGPQALAALGIEPRAGGMLYEIGPYGFRNDWGRVLTWDPPRRLVFTWQIGPDRVPVPDPAGASEVEVLFHPEGPELTRVEVEHRHLGVGPAGQRPQADRAGAAGQVEHARRPVADDRLDRVEHRREAVLPVRHERLLLPVPALLPGAHIQVVRSHAAHDSYRQATLSRLVAKVLQ